MGLCAVLDMRCVHAVQDGSHGPHTATEPWNVAAVTEELTFYFYIIVINLSLNGHMYLLATTLDSPDNILFSPLSLSDPQIFGDSSHVSLIFPFTAEQVF